MNPKKKVSTIRVASKASVLTHSSKFSLTHRAKPVLKWAGGKSQLLAQLLPHFPHQFDRFLEPFLGAGAVFFSLNPGCPALINDANPELYELYQVLREEPLRLAKKLDAYSKRYSEEFYYQLRSASPRNSVTRSARLIFLNKTGFNGLYRQNRAGKFNVPFGKRVKCPALYDLENLRNVSLRLRKAKILNVDFESILEKAKKGDFVYCDPPYAPLSASSSFNCYTAGGFTLNDQKRLKEACVKAAKRGAIIAVSNSSAPNILELYENWKIHLIKARRSINSKSHLRGEINEVLGTLNL